MLFVLQNNPDGRPALAARKWFADNGPPDLLPLPLGYNEREALKHGGIDHILAWYARSPTATTTLRRIRRSTNTPAA